MFFVAKYVLSFVFLCLCSRKTVSAAKPETTYTVFTFYENSMSWNEAMAACDKIGGRLANVKNEIKEASLVSAVDHLITKSLIDGKRAWIGLHKKDNFSDYKWSDCSNLTHWQSWNKSYIRNGTENLCVSLDTDLLWNPTNCSERLPALCETLQPCGCYMEKESNSCADLQKTKSTISTSDSLEDCKNKCMHHSRGQDECWATTYYGHLKDCYLHERMTYTTSCPPDLIFYTKNCFILTFPELVVRSENPNYSPFPDSNCSSEEIAEKENVGITEEPCVFDGEISSPSSTRGTATARIISTSPTTPNTVQCVCYKRQNTTLRGRLEWLRVKTRVDKASTSQHKRRKISATDPRLSACGIGAAGLVVLISVVVGIMLLDINRLRVDFSKGINNVTHCWLKTKQKGKCPFKTRKPP